jgi:hypothetical protein
MSHATRFSELAAGAQNVDDDDVVAGRATFQLANEVGYQ